MSDWGIGLDELRDAERIVREAVPPTPLRHYPQLDEAFGGGVRVLVKHENHLPTNAFKARNGLVALHWLTDQERKCGVVGATRGNHGQGLAWAGQALGIPVTVCVPHGNSPAKNSAMRALGAELVEVGETYDEAVEAADRLVQEEGLTLIHSTNNRGVLAGAATIALEVLEQAPETDAFVISVGGGSQATGAIRVCEALGLDKHVYGVQAAKASAIHDSWHAGQPQTKPPEETLADGLATGAVYPATFEMLQRGLRGFVTVEEEEIAEAIRLLLLTTQNVAEGAGAAGLAGLGKLRKKLDGKTVVTYLSGGNIDVSTLAASLSAS